jgi:hypothetical protein
MSERMPPETLVAELVRNGVIAADAAPLPPPPEDRPWFVNALLGFAGWLAGIFVLVFIAMAFKPHDTSTFAVLAAVLLAAAFGLYAVGRRSAFFDQLALAASIAGQIAATFAFAKGTNDSLSITTACVAVLQCVLVLVMPNRLARALAAFFACVAWALTIRFMWWGDGEDWSGTRHPVSLAPALIGWAVIWIPVGAACIAAISGEARWMAHRGAQILRPALSGMLLALTFGTFASEPLDTFEWLLTSSGPRPQNWLVLWPLLNAGTALLAGFGAFHLRNKALLGVAIAAALLHLGQFYFLLGTTLVMKSVIMVAVGALLLGLGALLNRHSTSRNGATT